MARRSSVRRYGGWIDDFAAVARWLPPGGEVDGEAIVVALSGSVLADKHADTFSVLEQMEGADPNDAARVSILARGRLCSPRSRLGGGATGAMRGAR